MSSQTKEPWCLENVFAAVFNCVLHVLLISPAWGQQWNHSGQPSSRRGSRSGCWAHFSANGLGALNSADQPMVGPRSHKAGLARTDSIGTIAIRNYLAPRWQVKIKLKVVFLQCFAHYVHCATMWYVWFYFFSLIWETSVFFQIDSSDYLWV